MADKHETQEQRAARYAAIAAESPTLSLDQYRRRSRRSVLTGAAAMAAGFGGWRWIQGQAENDRIPGFLRDNHERNEALWRALFRDNKLAPTYDRSRSSMIRVTGRRGIDDEIDLDTWELRVEAPDGSLLGTHVLADIAALPKLEMTVEHKCVEGWSHIVTWGGTPFSNLVALYEDELGELPGFVSMETPGSGYYVGIEMAAALHPQTMLTYELEGEALSQDHGAPLRLTTPLKYGIKQIKRIGTIRFTDEQPDDYWAERGYDWYAAL